MPVACSLCFSPAHQIMALSLYFPFLLPMHSGRVLLRLLAPMSSPSSLHSAEVTVSWELFVLLKRHPQCHWSVLCLCRCWWGMPAACVTAGAMSVFAFLRNKLHFKVILLIFTPAFQHSFLFDVGLQQNYCSLLSPTHHLFKVGCPGCGTCATCGSVSSHSPLNLVLEMCLLIWPMQANCLHK